MSDDRTSGSIRCQVAVIVSARGQILTCNSPSGPVLPSFSIARHERICEQIQSLFLQRWGLSIYVADLVRDDGVEEQSLWLAESLEPSVPHGLIGVPIDDLSAIATSSHLRARLRLRNNTDISIEPTSCIGWIGEAREWVEHVTGDQMLPPSTIKQYNGGGGFTLLRWEAVSGRSYWLKSVGEPNQHEFSITTFVCKLAPNVSPLLLATRPEWNAWLMLEDGARTADCRPSSLSAVEALVEIQGRSMEYLGELLDRGAFDQRSERIEEDLPILFDYLDESMHMQESAKSPRLSRLELDAVQDTILHVSRELTGHAPVSLLHGDLTGGNVSGDVDRCRFLDWCESYIGFASISLHHLIMLYSRAGMPPVDTNSMFELYRERWQKEFGVRIASFALASSPLLAALSALYGRGTWLDSDKERNRPQRRSYSRTLARHMAREARLLKERGELCHC